MGRMFTTVERNKVFQRLHELIAQYMRGQGRGVKRLRPKLSFMLTTAEEILPELNAEFGLNIRFDHKSLGIWVTLNDLKPSVMDQIPRWTREREKEQCLATAEI